ncbi:MAG: deoxyhypusine synthase [Candidatus Woesearchaeota archaeon]
MDITDESFEALKKKKLYGQPQNLNELTDLPAVSGFDFEKDVDLTSLLQSFMTTGFQATHLSQAINVVKTMRREGAKIYLTFTSNMISSGLRDIISYLVKHNLVDVLVTSAGGVEEDIMKIKAPFRLGSFEHASSMLFENGVFRIGNILVPNTRYAYLETFIDSFFAKLYAENKKTLATHEFVHELGKSLSESSDIGDVESSYIYWAYKNNIPVFCPGLVDGAIGDLVSFFRYNHKDFCIDTAGDSEKINRMTLQFEKTGVICLGAGLPKHFALNANILRDGFDYAVYINTAQEFDGCDSGARIDEAKTWSKIKMNAFSVKVHCDATIAFPLLVAGAFQKNSV